MSRPLTNSTAEGQVITVSGPRAASALGFTSMHEHVLSDATFMRRRAERTPDAWRQLLDSLPADLREEDPRTARVHLGNAGLLRRQLALREDNLRLDDEDVMAGELSDFRAGGGRAVLDLSGIGLRLDVEGVRRLAERSGVDIVVSAGFYREDSWPERYREFTADQFEAVIESEFTHGIDGTAIHPGHIKVAVTRFTVGEEHALRGAVRAAVATGSALTVHPGFGIGGSGARIGSIAVEEGLDPRRLVMAHGDAFLVEMDLRTLVLDPAARRLRLDYHRQLLDRGFTVSFDCFGHDWSNELAGTVIESDWERLAGVVTLIDEGYSSQLVLGTDTFVKILTRRGGGEGYCRLTRWVVPQLRRLGVSEYDIRQMTEVNPARLLTLVR